MATPPELTLSMIAAAPWLAPARARVLQSLHGGRLAHALLLQGRPGLGKRALAEWIARVALCEAPADDACGRCAACVLHAAGSHPDLQRIVIAEDKKQIAVEDIREMIAALTLKSYRGRRKVAIIDPADGMNASGANALLKTLEEPSGEALILLTVARPERLPATVGSRCQRIKLLPPTTEVALGWLRGIDPGVDWEPALALSAGAPVAALSLSGALQLDREMAQLPAQLARPDADIPALAERCQKAQPAERLRWIENWITERIRQGLLSPATGHTPETPGLPAGARRRHIQGLYQVLDESRTAQGALRRGSANVAMLFEGLFVLLARELEVLKASRGRG